jgi:hypothetical protein
MRYALIPYRRIVRPRTQTVVHEFFLFKDKTCWGIETPPSLSLEIFQSYLLESEDTKKMKAKWFTTIILPEISRTIILVEIDSNAEQFYGQCLTEFVLSEHDSIFLQEVEKPDNEASQEMTWVSFVDEPLVPHPRPTLTNYYEEYIAESTVMGPPKDHFILNKKAVPFDVLIRHLADQVSQTNCDPLTSQMSSLKVR